MKWFNIKAEITVFYAVNIFILIVLSPEQRKLSAKYLCFELSVNQSKVFLCSLNTHFGEVMSVHPHPYYTCIFKTTEWTLMNLEMLEYVYTKVARQI
jgi:hypothetical protein